MRCLLDTHTLLWWLFDDPKLSPRARTTIAAPENEILVSAASAWEIATKYRIGKLPEAGDIVSQFSLYLRKARFTALDVSVDHARATIASVQVLGALQASPEIKAALSDRIR